MKINLVGEVNGTSGFATHTRNLALALAAEGVDVAIEGSTPMPVDGDQRLKDMMAKDYHSEATIMITLPLSWPMKYPDNCKALIGYGIFEGDRVPRQWAEIAGDDLLTDLWVPSQHTADAFKAVTSVKEPVIIPHGVDTSVFNPEGPKMKDAELVDGLFKFLFVGGWKDGVKDRKGLDILCRAFTEEFGPEEPVQLIAKVNAAYADPRKTMADIGALNLKPPSQRAKASILFNNYTDAQLASLYRACDCFVMPTKAEAFCMPVVEALACGLPVIATGYGGQKEVLEACGCAGGIISYDMKPATGEFYFYEQAQWAEPRQEELQKQMRWFYENKGAFISDLAVKNVQEKYTWKITAQKAIARLKELGVE